MLRGLLGGLQWSSTQTAPFLQCSASQLSGEITKATVDTIDRASKVLRMAKANSDAGLRYHALGGDPKEVSFIGYTDASFASRKDLSSRGGFLAMMVHQSLVERQESTTSSTGDHGDYHELPGLHCQLKVRRPPNVQMPCCSFQHFGRLCGNLTCPWRTRKHLFFHMHLL